MPLMKTFWNSSFGRCENGPVNFSELFGDKQTLAVYSYMYGHKRE